MLRGVCFSKQIKELFLTTRFYSVKITNYESTNYEIPSKILMMPPCLTNSKKHSPWYTNSCSTNQEIPRLLR
jgi:hypothetical protein